MDTRGITLSAASVRDRRVIGMIDALTAELAGGGYTDEQTFGYSVEQLAAGGVHLVAAEIGGDVVGIGGVEVGGDGTGELKRFFVVPAARGSGAADAILGELVAYARARGVRTLRLETGDKQHAAMAFYRRHGFAEIPRFGPYVDSETSVCMERPL